MRKKKSFQKVGIEHMTSSTPVFRLIHLATLATSHLFSSDSKSYTHVKFLTIISFKLLRISKNCCIIKINRKYIITY